MFSTLFKKKQPLQAPPQPIQPMPPPTTLRDMTCVEIQNAIKLMKDEINTIPQADRFEKIWIEDAEKGIQRELQSAQLAEYKRRGGKRKTRKIRHRFTQNRK
jgi:hypothetical protein